MQPTDAGMKPNQATMFPQIGMCSSAFATPTKSDRGAGTGMVAIGAGLPSAASAPAEGRLPRSLVPRSPAASGGIGAFHPGLGPLAFRNRRSKPGQAAVSCKAAWRRSCKAAAGQSGS